MNKRRWTAEDDDGVRRGHAAGLRYKAIAALLGRSVPAIKGRAALLGLTAPKPPVWTAEEEAQLLALMETHKTYAEIGRLLKRSRTAVQDRATHVLKTSARTCNGMPMLAIGRLLGIDGKTPAWWADQGWLVSHRYGQHKRGAFRIVEYDDMLAFLSDPRYWHVWDPERIRDAGLRLWARELREGVVFLTLPEAAARLCMSPAGVNRAIREGRLPAAKYGGYWRVRADQCVMWERRKPTAQRFATVEDYEFVERHWGTHPISWLATERRLSTATIAKIGTALGLPGLGSGYWSRLRAAQRHSGKVQP